MTSPEDGKQGAASIRARKVRVLKTCADSTQNAAGFVSLSHGSICAILFRCCLHNKCCEATDLTTAKRIKVAGGCGKLSRSQARAEVRTFANQLDRHFLWLNRQGSKVACHVPHDPGHTPESTARECFARILTYLVPNIYSNSSGESAAEWQFHWAASLQHF
eukprot:symbB.v1.2.020816.t1/scaffold1761.1/size106227/5